MAPIPSPPPSMTSASPLPRMAQKFQLGLWHPSKEHSRPEHLPTYVDMCDSHSTPSALATRTLLSYNQSGLQVIPNDLVRYNRVYI